MQNSRKVFTLGLILWLLLNGYGSTHLQKKKENQENHLSSIITSTTTPMSPIKSIEDQPPKRYLCITSSLPKTWPVDAAITEWNKNKVNEFRLDSSSTLCKPAGAIVLIEERMTCCMGEASFLNGKVTIRFNPDVPQKQRQHVVCHELGHVLGLIHNKDKSCMNISTYNPLPSPGDLAASAAQEWQWSRIVKAVHDDGR